MADDSDREPQAEAAPALALAAASRQRADDYLLEQTRLARLQIARERREERLRDWSQFVEYTSAVLKLAFEFAVALIVIVVIGALGTALWNASHDNGLVVEAFSVPPDLEARGLTGEVIAGKVLDRLRALQVQTASSRAASSYVNNWGNDIKVQIPETGVSIGQLYRYMAVWLGHETHISGEITRDAAGLAVTARVGGQPAATVRGNDAGLDGLVQQAAEAVYRTTQPYRYAVYADNHGRSAEATAIYHGLIAGGAADDRAWAYIGLAAQRSAVMDFDGAARLLRKAAALRPDIALIYSNLANNEASQQHDEQELAYARDVVALAARGGHDNSMGDLDFRLIVLQNRLSAALQLGDVAAAQAFDRQIEALPDDNGTLRNARVTDLPLCAGLHDRACLESALDALAGDAALPQQVNREANEQQADLIFEDYRAAAALAPQIVAALNTVPVVGRFFLLRAEYPALAVARAGLGDVAAARALIAQTPLDCVACLRARGRVAMMARDWGAADYWYARAAKAAPSTPFPFADRGAMRLGKGDIAGAIAQFALAHDKGPRFADPLESWGEALIAQNRSDLALAKFAEAGRYAPNWGRLHLKWGEALLWLGDKPGARKQFAIAAGLYLLDGETAELKRAATR